MFETSISNFKNSYLYLLSTWLDQRSIKSFFAKEKIFDRHFVTDVIGLKSYLNVFIRTARFLLLVFQPILSLIFYCFYCKSTQIYLKLESRKYFNALPQLSCSQLFDSLWTSSVTYKETICECEHVVLLLQMLRPFLGLCGCNVQYFVPNVSPSGHV